MHNRFRASQVKQVTEARLEAQQLVIDRESPAINAVHGIDIPRDRLHVQRLFVQRNAQLVASANLAEIVANGLRPCQQPVGKSRNQHGPVVVKSQKPFKITGIDGKHPFLENLLGLFHVSGSLSSNRMHVEKRSQTGCAKDGQCRVEIIRMAANKGQPLVGDRNRAGECGPVSADFLEITALDEYSSDLILSR